MPGEYTGRKYAEVQGQPRPSVCVNLTKLECKYTHRHTIPIPDIYMVILMNGYDDLTVFTLFNSKYFSR